MGILSFAWLAVRSRLAELPAGVRWQHLIGVAPLAGIGFTMSLFVASLAFSEPDLGEVAKLGILAASGISAVLGIALAAATGRSAPTASSRGRSHADRGCRSPD